MSLLCILEEVSFSAGPFTFCYHPEGQFLQCLVRAAGPELNRPLQAMIPDLFWNYKHQFFRLHSTHPLFLKVLCGTFKIKVDQHGLISEFETI